MEGYLKIRNYRIQCTMGLLEHEKKEKQEILVDLYVKTDFSECVQTDSVADTLDYRELGKTIEEVAQAEHFNLLETYAHEALHALFSQYSIAWAKIRVKKKSAIPFADYVLVEMEREA